MPQLGACDSVAGTRPALSPRAATLPFRGLIEAVSLLWIYLAYSQLRAMATGSEHVALENARRVVRLEQLFRVSSEQTLQQLALRIEWVAVVSNLWYGTVHFIAPIAVLVVLWQKAPAHYLRMRNTLVITFALGLVAFAAFPLMPPRMMPGSYNFVDTGHEYFHIDASLGAQLGASDRPTTSDFAQGANEFAAMPSMHVTWSTWVALALWPFVRRRRLLRALLVAYPLSILLCVTVTGNHWFLDAVGGWIVLAASYRLALGIETMSIVGATRFASLTKGRSGPSLAPPEGRSGIPDSLPSLLTTGRSGESGIPRFASFAPDQRSLRRIGDFASDGLHPALAHDGHLSPRVRISMYSGDCGRWK